MVDGQTMDLFQVLTIFCATNHTVSYCTIFLEMFLNTFKIKASFPCINKAISFQLKEAFLRYSQRGPVGNPLKISCNSESILLF